MVATDARSSLTTLIIPAGLKRTGLKIRFVVDGADDREADISLTRIMVRAQAIRDRLLRDNGLSIDEVAREEGCQSLLCDPPHALDVSRARYCHGHSHRMLSARADYPQAHGRHTRAVAME